MIRMVTSVAFALAMLAAATSSALADSTQKSTRADSSYQTAQNWNDRVCCKRGAQDWWTTRRACNRSGGYQVSNRQCREDWNDRWDQRWWGWQGGDWSRRVCCKYGNRDWWSTARECRNSFGYITNDRNIAILTDLSGQTFYGGDSLPNVQWTGSVSDFPIVTPVVMFESDGAGLSGITVEGQGMFFQGLPRISTDRARLAVYAHNNSNDLIWFFADGYFSIRHDPRFGFEPPSVQLLAPLGGERFAGGSTLAITWHASAAQGLRSFDIQASYDSGRTWHPIARDLPGDATAFDWNLPASSGIPDLRVRLIVRDQRFQNSSATSGPFEIAAGTGVPGDLDSDGDVDLDDYVIFHDCLAGPGGGAAAGCEAPDLDGDLDVDLGDVAAFQEAF